MSAAVQPVRRVATADHAVRGIGGALLVATGGIHLHLYVQGYRTIHLVGPSFLANAVLAVLAAGALLLAPSRLLGPVALLAGLLELGTLVALGLSLTIGLFGFTESTRAPLVPLTIAVEACGAILLIGYGLRRLRQRAPRSRRG